MDGKGGGKKTRKKMKKKTALTRVGTRDLSHEKGQKNVQRFDFPAGGPRRYGPAVNLLNRTDRISDDNKDFWRSNMGRCGASSKKTCI
jgi:hypothetical protein